MPKDQQSAGKQILVTVCGTVLSAYLIYTFGFNRTPPSPSGNPAPASAPQVQESRTAEKSPPAATSESSKLVGVWISRDLQRELRWVAREDGTCTQSITTSLGTQTIDGKWQYSDGILDVNWDDGGLTRKTRSRIRWVDRYTSFEVSDETEGPSSYAVPTMIYVKQ